MKNEDILKKAIEKAVKNGYSHGYFLKVWEIKGEGLTKLMSHYFEIILSHDFAKAFWPLYNRHRLTIEDQNTVGTKEIILDDWQYHLQQMVIFEDPIKYLERFL